MEQLKSIFSRGMSGNGTAIKSAFLAAFLVPLISCTNRELYACPDCETLPVQVIIHWQDAPQESLPEFMHTVWYPSRGGERTVADLKRDGGPERLAQEHYTAACFDYYGENGLEFRGSDTPAGLEAYTPAESGLYNRYGDPLPGEPTVAEPKTAAFYTHTCPQDVDMESVAPGDTLKLHFYPENVLREFTFLIHGIKGVKNMAYNSGAISGMSASYFIVRNQLSRSPSTVLFGNGGFRAIVNGRAYSWSREEREAFSRLNPDWDNEASADCWKDGWITGRFRTFGPVDGQTPIRLTIEAVSNANLYYTGAWGYWKGAWDESVLSQVQSALLGSGEGTVEERRQWWRQRNGGYDIVLDNFGRLEVPDVDVNPPGPTPGEGGINVGVGGWESTPVYE